MSSSSPPNNDHKAAEDSLTVKRPPFSYTALIMMALKSSPDKKLTLQEIYTYIMDNYIYYRTSTGYWKNSVRRRLSINKRFIKVNRSDNDKGMGGYWMMKGEDEMSLDSRGPLAKKSVDTPTMLPAYLPPTPMPPYPPNALFGVVPPMPFILTPMMMPPAQIDLQMVLQLLCAQQQFQQQIGTLFPKME